VTSDRLTADARASAALMKDLTTLVSEAAAVIKRIGPEAARQRLKGDQTPVSDADEAAEAVLLEGLARLVPGVPVVSEEACARGARPRAGTRFFLVDPLDGTREFLAGLEEYTVNVALVADGVPELGIIAAPAQDRIWRGVIGRGGERLDLAPGAPPAAARNLTPLHARRRPARGVTAMVSRSHLDPQTAAFVAALPNAEQIACGSSLKFCRLAEGLADVYPRLAPTHEWDIAAGHAVLAASGGAMTTPEGAAIPYGSCADDFLVPGFLAWADPAAAVKS